MIVLCVCLAVLVPTLSPQVAWRDDPDWENLLASAAPGQQILLEFTATWCGPCKLLNSEVLENPEVVAELEPLLCARLDVDNVANAALCDRFAVSSLPTVILCTSDGQEIDRIRGFQGRDTFLAKLRRFKSGVGSLPDLKERLADDPDAPAVQVEAGLRYAERLDLRVAADLLARGLARWTAPDSAAAATAWRTLADVHHRLGDDAAAARDLRDLLARWPDHAFPAVTLRGLAEYSLAAGDTTGSLAALDQLLAMRPDDVAALAAFAATCASAGVRLDEAERRARHAIEIAEVPYQAMDGLAAVLLRRGEYAEALLWCKRAAASDPQAQDRATLRASLREAAVMGDWRLDARLGQLAANRPAPVSEVDAVR